MLKEVTSHPEFIGKLVISTLQIFLRKPIAATGPEKCKYFQFDGNCLSCLQEGNNLKFEFITHILCVENYVFSQLLHHLSIQI